MDITTIHPCRRPTFRLKLWLGLALVATPVTAQIQPGRVYSGGERISDPSSGLHLTLPQGWRGQLSPDGSAFMLQSESGGGYMFVTADQMTEAQARAEMSQPVDLGNGVRLMPAGEIQQVATSHLSARYTVRGAPGEMLATADVRLTRDGLGVAFIVLSPPQSADAHREAMREFAFSLGMTEPQAQSAGGADEWEPYLRGRYLARYFTRTGYTESTELWLCSDHTFYYNSQGGGFGGGASGAAQATGGGRWSATGAGRTGTLQLQWGNGETSSWSLEYDYENDRVFVNGQRMLRGNNERCR